MNRTRGSISIRLPAPTLGPAELRRMSAPECAAPDLDDPAPFSEGLQLGALVAGLIVAGAGVVALVAAFFSR